MLNNEEKTSYTSTESDLGLRVKGDKFQFRSVLTNSSCTFEEAFRILYEWYFDRAMNVQNGLYDLSTPGFSYDRKQVQMGSVTHLTKDATVGRLYPVVEVYDLRQLYPSLLGALSREHFSCGAVKAVLENCHGIMTRLRFDPAGRRAAGLVINAVYGMADRGLISAQGMIETVANYHGTISRVSELIARRLRDEKAAVIYIDVDRFYVSRDPRRYSCETDELVAHINANHIIPARYVTTYTNFALYAKKKWTGIDEDNVMQVRGMGELSGAWRKVQQD